MSIKGGVYPHWSADGGALTYVQSDGQTPPDITRVPVMGLQGSDASPTFGTPRKLFAYKYFSFPDGRSDFDMTADGKRFLMITPGPQGDKADRLVLVQNWSQELKHLVPTK